MITFDLTPQQLDVIGALSSGATTTAAAALAGVHRNSVSNWRRSSFPFREALAHAEYDKALLHREKAEALVDLAYQQLEQLLADPKTPPTVRLKAIQYIIDKASTPPPPKSETILDIQAPEVPNTAQQPYRRESPKIGRNEPCPCKSGKKFKQCCLNKPNVAAAV